MTSTRSPILIESLSAVVQRVRGWRDLRYSDDHRRQKPWVIPWTSCHRFKKLTGCSGCWGSGGRVRQPPTQKWAGVKTAKLSGDVSDWLFKHASIWHRWHMVVSSSKLSLADPVMRRRWCLVDFTAASHSPPICGALGGLKCRSVPSVARDSITVLLFWQCSV